MTTINQQIASFVNGAAKNGNNGFRVFLNCLDHLAEGQWTPIVRLIHKANANDAKQFRLMFGMVATGYTIVKDEKHETNMRVKARAAKDGANAPAFNLDLLDDWRRMAFAGNADFRNIGKEKGVKADRTLAEMALAFVKKARAAGHSQAAIDAAIAAAGRELDAKELLKAA